MSRRKKQAGRLWSLGERVRVEEEEEVQEAGWHAIAGRAARVELVVHFCFEQ